MFFGACAAGLNRRIIVGATNTPVEGNARTRSSREPALCVGLAIVLVGSVSGAQPPVGEPSYLIVAGKAMRQLSGGKPVDLGLPCPVRLLANRGDEVFAVCGDDRLIHVVVPDVAGVRVRSERRVGGRIRALFVRHGRVWAEQVKVLARPAVDFARRTTQPGSGLMRARQRLQGRVVKRVRNGVVVRFTGVVDWEPDQRFLVTPAKGRAAPGGRRPIGELLEARGRELLVGLHRNEIVPVGSRVLPTRSWTLTRRLAPPAVPQQDALTLRIQPMIDANAAGGGVTLSGAVGRRFSPHLRAEAIVHDLTFGFGTYGGFAAVSAGVRGWLQDRFAAVGLGAGWYGAYGDWGHDAPWVEWVCRLGARDGIAARGGLWSGWATDPYGGRRALIVGWHFDAQVPVPFAPTLMAMFRSRSSLAGNTHGSFVLRWHASGAGNARVMDVDIGLGGAQLDVPRRTVGWTRYSGPQLTVGVRWRR